MPTSAVPAIESVTPAVVVRVRAFGESDKIVTFLTRDLGKVAGIAKGAKRSKRRFANVLEPLAHVSVRLRQRPSSDLAFVVACELVDAHLTFARDLAKYAHACYMVELTDRMIRGREAGPEAYELVRDALAWLERHRAEAGLLRAFELHLLRHTGYEPAFDRCQRCGADLASQPRLFVHPMRGGVRCGRCRGEGRNHVGSRQTLEHLIALQSARFTDDDDARFALPPEIAAEARVLVRSFFTANLHAPLVSERLLDDLTAPTHARDAPHAVPSRERN